MSGGCTNRGGIGSASGEPLRKAEVNAAKLEKQLRYLASPVRMECPPWTISSPANTAWKPAATDTFRPPTAAGRYYARHATDSDAPSRDWRSRFPPRAAGGAHRQTMDEDDDPFQGAHVSPLREADFGHGKQLAPRPASPVTSDDRASSASLPFRPARGSSPPRSASAAPSLDYPDTFNEDEAKAIRIDSGAERSGFELRMRNAGVSRARATCLPMPTGRPYGYTTIHGSIWREFCRGLTRCGHPATKDVSRGRRTSTSTWSTAMSRVSCCGFPKGRRCGGFCTELASRAVSRSRLRTAKLRCRLPEP